MRVRAACCALAFVAAALPASLEWAELPQDVLVPLEAKARAYARRALGFTCREERRRATYDRGGEASRERTRTYDLLLALDEGDARPRGLRAAPGDPDAAPDRGTLDCPEAYLWTQLFADPPRGQLTFRVGGWHTGQLRRLLPVSWNSTAPVGDLRKIEQWSGTIELEHTTGNPVRVIARPNFQDDVLLARRAEYIQSTPIIFFGIEIYRPKPHPIGHEVEILFAEEHDGFSYPTRLELRTFEQSGPRPGDRRPLRTEVAEYGAYRFFATFAKEEIPPLVAPSR